MYRKISEVSDGRATCLTRTSDHTHSTMQFTCNLCGCTTISPVNPHAFHTGSLFARCGNTECGVIHKVGLCTCGFVLDLRVLCDPEPVGL